MDITINLANEPFIDLRPVLKLLRKTTVVLASVLLLLLLLLYFVHRKTNDAILNAQSVESRRAAQLRERQGYETQLHSPQSVDILARTRDLNQIVDSKVLSWTLVMEELESVLPGGVQVNAIQPIRARDGNVTLRIRVTGQREKSIDLVRHLELSQCFIAPRIVDESAGTSGKASLPASIGSAPSTTQFDLLVGYSTCGSDIVAAAPLSLKAVETHRAHPVPNRHEQMQPVRHTLIMTNPIHRLPSGGAR